MPYPCPAPAGPSSAEQGREVTDTITGKGEKHLVKLTVDTDGSKGKRTDTITAIEGHPFRVPDIGRWADAGDLTRGDWLRTSSGTWVQVKATKSWTARTTVHNLSVDGVHTYSVLAGDTEVLALRAFVDLAAPDRNGPRRADREVPGRGQPLGCSRPASKPHRDTSSSV